MPKKNEKKNIYHVNERPLMSDVCVFVRYFFRVSTYHFQHIHILIIN